MVQAPRRVGAMTAAKAPRRTNKAIAHVDPREAISPASRKILDGFRLEDIASHLLRRAHFAAEELFAQEFADESITPRQKAALVMLYQNPGLSQNALADRLFMDRSTVAEMVKRLASSGLIRRAAAKDDQRAYELFLAPGGAALLDRVMPRDMQVEQKVLERLPAEYLPLFIKCVRLIVDQQPLSSVGQVASVTSMTPLTSASAALAETAVAASAPRGR